MTQEKRRRLFLGLFAMAIGIGFGWPLAEDVQRGTLRRSRRGRALRRGFSRYVTFVLHAAIAVGAVLVGATSILKALNYSIKDQKTKDQKTQGSADSEDS
jgi:hypothetical protein